MIENQNISCLVFEAQRRSTFLNVRVYDRIRTLIELLHESYVSYKHFNATIGDTIGSLVWKN